MALSDNSDRKTFTSTMNIDLYEKLQGHSKKTNIPISKLLDQAVEKLLSHTFTIEDENLYSYLCLFYATKGLDVDEQIEKILQEHVSSQIKVSRKILRRFGKESSPNDYTHTPDHNNKNSTD